MKTSANAAFRGIPPILNRIWRTRNGDWFKAGSAFAIEIKNTSPHGIDPKDWADSLSDAVANLDGHEAGSFDQGRPQLAHRPLPGLDGYHH